MCLRCEIVVNSMWVRCDIDAISLWNQSETDMNTKKNSFWNLCGCCTWAKGGNKWGIGNEGYQCIHLLHGHVDHVRHEPQLSYGNILHSFFQTQFHWNDCATKPMQDGAIWSNEWKVSLYIRFPYCPFNIKFWNFFAELLLAPFWYLCSPSMCLPQSGLSWWETILIQWSSMTQSTLTVPGWSPGSVLPNGNEDNV